jgi:hypothetical protein
MVAALNEGADIGDTGGAQQLSELSQLVAVALGTGREKICALTSAPTRVVPIGRRLACASVAAALHPGSG